MNSDLAKLFSELLIKEIGKDNAIEANARNKVTDDIYICHSHDFCDANMVMLEAWRKHTNKGDDGFFQDDVFDEVNIAWHEAKANKFYVEAINVQHD